MKAKPLFRVVLAAFLRTVLAVFLLAVLAVLLAAVLFLAVVLLAAFLVLERAFALEAFLTVFLPREVLLGI